MYMNGSYVISQVSSAPGLISLDIMQAVHRNGSMTYKRKSRGRIDDSENAQKKKKKNLPNVIHQAYQGMIKDEACTISIHLRLPNGLIAFRC